MKLPPRMLRHRLTVEPYRGATGNGPAYGPAVEVPCHLEATRSTTRTPATGRSAGDTSTAWCDLVYAAVITPEARVTFAGRVVEGVSVTRRDYPGVPGVPEHLEVTFV